MDNLFSNSRKPLPRSPAAAFVTTRWTCVRQAKADSEDGRRALAELCDAYYEPVVTYLRCALGDADAAREAGHAFFAEVLEGGAIGAADQARGRFRSYLLGALKHFLFRQRQSASRQKRGGGREPLSIDDDGVVELQDARQPAPDAEFDRQWAVTVLARGLEALRLELQSEGRGEFFEAAKPLLTGEVEHGQQAELAASCGLGLDAFRMAAHRLKRRLRQCVTTEVAGTLDDPATVQEEMRALFSALGG